MTCSQLNCLLEMKRLSERMPEVASVRLTKSLHLSKPSVHRLLEGLVNLGLIEKEYYGAACLTEKGAKLADTMLAKLEKLAARLGEDIVRPESSRSAALLLLSGLDEDCFACFPKD